MKLYDSFRSALQSLVVNKLRSALTMLGVIIGVASVIAMVAVGNGASQTVQQQVLALGSNLITVTPGVQAANGLRAAGSSAAIPSLRTLSPVLSKVISTARSATPALCINTSPRWTVQRQRTNMIRLYFIYQMQVIGEAIRL